MVDEPNEVVPLPPPPGGGGYDTTMEIYGRAIAETHDAIDRATYIGDLGAMQRNRQALHMLHQQMHQAELMQQRAMQQMQGAFGQGGYWPGTNTLGGGGGGGYWLGTQAQGIGGSGGGWSTFAATPNSTFTVYPPPPDQEIIIDEELYVQQREYWDLARARGQRWRLRTEEEARERAEAQRQQREREEQVKREQAAAEERSKQLLLEHLTPEQHRQYMRNGWFSVIGENTGHEYRIDCRHGFSGNIEEFWHGTRIARICCHGRSVWMPKFDHFLAQAISIMAAEADFLRVACRTAV